MKFKYINSIDYIEYKNINNLNKNFDWIIACPVETSTGFKIPIEDLYKFKKKFKSKLALDATASIGLEKNHYLIKINSFLN